MAKIFQIDFSSVNSLWDIHEAITNGLSLPEFYGKNPDALWDCLTGMIETPCVIYLHGLHNVPHSLSTGIAEIVEVFYSANKEMPEIAINRVE